VALYAAYGSNLDPEQMLSRCPHSPVLRTGWLKGWRIGFGGEDQGWEGALATIVEEPGGHVFVALYDMTEADEATLDGWEGADSGLYTKIRVRAHSLGAGPEGLLAWTYVLNEYEGGLPSARYLGVMADAAETAGAPDDYVTELRSRPARSIGD
jgi:hypothetical protein